jgi:hypothetical protein
MVNKIYSTAGTISERSYQTGGQRYSQRKKLRLNALKVSKIGKILIVAQSVRRSKRQIISVSIEKITTDRKTLQQVGKIYAIRVVPVERLMICG